MPSGISFPSVRLTSYALRARLGGPALGTFLSTNVMIENAPPGTIIGTLTCTGALGVPVFSLIDNAGGRVALGGPNNSTVVAGLVNSDYETTPFFNFIVSIDGIDPQLPNTMFTVYLLDAAEFPPVIISNGGGATASISIPENTTVVTTVVATDADVGVGSVVTYSISGGADAGKFTINPSTGALQFINPPDYEAPASAAGTNVYTVIVRASDGTFADTQTVTVTVTDVFDPVDTTPPTITSSASISIFENATLTHTLTASEPVVWTLSGAADIGRFTLVGSTLSMAPKDFESPVDANADNIYIVQVTATDPSGNASSQTITVTVNAVNEFAPVINSNGGGATASISIPENTTIVTTVTATDADVGDIITYSISGGADAARFTINSSNGALAFSLPPDFEAPTDANADNQYIVIVQASDGSNTDTQTITVTVTDVSDAITNYRLTAGAGSFVFTGEDMTPVTAYTLLAGAGALARIDPGTTKLTPPAAYGISAGAGGFTLIDPGTTKLTPPAPAYTGPGDVTGWGTAYAYWGLRAYNASKIGTPCVYLGDKANGVGANTVTINSAANGYVDTVAITNWVASIVPPPSTIYCYGFPDQVGSQHIKFDNNLALAPILNLNTLAGLPTVAITDTGLHSDLNATAQSGAITVSTIASMATTSGALFSDGGSFNFIPIGAGTVANTTLQHCSTQVNYSGATFGTFHSRRVCH